MLASGKILQRFYKSAKYTEEEWEQLQKMLAENEPASIVCGTFGIKKSYYKELKRIYETKGSLF
jgi:hypothetical protein